MATAVHPVRHLRTEGFDPDDPYNEDAEPDDIDRGNVVYLVEGGHPDHPYAPRAAWDAVITP